MTITATTIHVFGTDYDPLTAGHYPHAAVIPGMVLVDLAMMAVRNRIAAENIDPLPQIHAIRTAAFRQPALPYTSLDYTMTIDAEDVLISIEKTGTDTPPSRVASIRLHLSIPATTPRGQNSKAADDPHC